MKGTSKLMMDQDMIVAVKTQLDGDLLVGRRVDPLNLLASMLED